MAFVEGYIDVAQRIVEFRTKHPDGSLQPANLTEPYRVETIGDQTFVVVVAAAYRSPDDQRPGIGMAYEQFPGRTPYTKGSELQNCETSAWGRAIVAALAADTKQGIASADEVRNRQAEREQPEKPKTEADKLRDQIRDHCTATSIDPREIAEDFRQVHGGDIRVADEQTLRGYLASLTSPPDPGSQESTA